MKVSIERLLSVGSALAFAMGSSGVARASEGEDELVVAAKPTPPAQEVAPTRANADGSPSAVDARVRGLEAAVAALTVANEKAAVEKPLWLRPFTISGFVQAEYQSHQDSEDELAQGGALLNKDRFVLRRGRVRVDGQWQYAHVQLEVDGNTQRGPQLRVLHGFATLKLPQLHDSEYTRDQPLAAVTMGLFDTPFGSELTEGPRTRWFMERSLASQSLFPAEPDVGVRFSGALYFLRWSVAAMNGEPLEQRVGYSSSKWAPTPILAKIYRSQETCPDFVARAFIPGSTHRRVSCFGGTRTRTVRFSRRSLLVSQPLRLLRRRRSRAGRWASIFRRDCGRDSV